MSRRDIYIAVVEDDFTLNEAIKKALEGAGFSVLQYKHPDDVLAAIKLREIHAFIIDCMLPKISGLDLAIKIHEHQPNSHVILMSGIFQDKPFIKEAMSKAKAVKFLSKPFHTDELLKELDKLFQDTPEENLEPLERLQFNSTISSGEIIDAIKNTPNIHGYQFPSLLTYLNQAKANGILKLANNEIKEAFVHIKNGAVVQVNVHDPKSFFGALLVDYNYLSTDDLEAALKAKNSKRLGERLVDMNLLSPHVIDIINVEQLALRVSQLVQNAGYSVNYEEVEVLSFGTFLDRNTIYRFCSEWLNSKLTLEWINTVYLPLMDKKISKASQHTEISPLYQLDPVNHMDGFADALFSNKSIDEILAMEKWSDEDVMKAIHLFWLAGYISFDRTSNSKDLKALSIRLQKIRKDMENQNHFEVLGLSPKARSSAIKKAYYELSKLFHPDKLDANAPEDVIGSTKYIFSKISKAYEVLSNDSLKSEYLKELEQGEAEKIFESESLMEQGKSFLNANQPVKALKIFQEAIALRPPTAELRLHHLWAKLLCIPKENIQIYLKEVQSELNRIPPEERHNAIYYFVKGLFNKQLGDLEQALHNIKHAVSLQPNFIIAKRELRLIELQEKNKPVDLLNADLKDVVGLLFKRKK